MDEERSNAFVELEHQILEFWDQQAIFAKSIEKSHDAPFFSFYDGPPFATGLPHYGHLLASIIKDVVPRYKTMKGFCVPRRFGWDCHGLPIEQEVEKKLGLSGVEAIEEYGIPGFNEACRSIVLSFTQEWERTIRRIGRWVDFSETWKTMDRSFMESVWWVFGTLYDQGLIYEGFKVMPFSAKLGTPLSNFEAGENYKEVDDPSVVVKLRLEEENTYLLAWTTTPWTLVSNLGVMVGEEISYVLVEDKGERYFLAEASKEQWCPEGRVLQKLRGKDLLGRQYFPIFNYFEGLKQQGAFRVIAEDSVATDEGTGIVQCAPAFGEADFYAAQRNGVPVVCPVDSNGRFTHEIPEYEGLFVKDADKMIIQRLKELKLLFYRGTIRHRYPFCWRSDTPLIYRAMKTWFVRVEALKERLLAANAQIHWMPEHIKEGRFGKWLEQARDWAISRNRYWGTPIPLWKSADGQYIVIHNREELEEKTGVSVTDLHRHHMDHLVIHHQGKEFRRIPEVFDCWFDAGSMPYAQHHYPFDHTSDLKQWFPADFIAEGIDQTRGWFYTLTVLAVALFDRPAFKNVIVNGILLAENGQKMSKRLKNYPEPTALLEKYGADAVRLYLLHSAAVKGEDLRVSEKGIDLIVKKVLLPLYNALSFFETYQKITCWKFRIIQENPTSTLDRWILAKVHQLVHDVEHAMEWYDLSSAVEGCIAYIDQLTNWYIRRSRRRFWSDFDTPDREEAFATLYTVLIYLSGIAAPFIPFFTEWMYRKLRCDEDPISVHLSSYPVYDVNKRDEVLEGGMEAVQRVVGLGHALRKEHKLKVRQPLRCLTVACQDPRLLKFIESQKELIQDELNIKNTIFHDTVRSYATLIVRPHFRILGKKLGSAMKEAQEEIAKLSEEHIHRLEQGKGVELRLSIGPYLLTQEDVEIVPQVREDHVASSVGCIAVALDITLTEELVLEGIGRDLINKINKMRKEANFAVMDYITVTLCATSRVKKALEIHQSYVQSEVLATEMRYSEQPVGEACDINGEPTYIMLEIDTKVARPHSKLYGV